MSDGHPAADDSKARPDLHPGLRVAHGADARHGRRCRTLHLPVQQAIAVALVIATVKGSLVACYFMHLISEKKLILWVMALTVAFFVVLLLVPVWTVGDRIGG